MTNNEPLAELETLRAQLALTICRGCGRPVTTYVQPGMLATSPVYVYGTCFNETCERFTITREVNDLYNMTAEKVAEFNQAKVNSAQ